MSQNTVAQIIEYYVPEKFIRLQAKWKPPAALGKVIGFQRNPAAKTNAMPTVALTNNWMAFSPR
jgi:hypothetical protein